MKSKILQLLLLALILTTSFSAFAQYGPENKRFGVGIYAGEPTGVTVKGYVAQRFSIQAIGSWSFVDEGFTIIGDALWDIFDIQTGSSKIKLPFYLGAGGKISINNKNTKDDETSFGVHFPVGIAVHWNDFPLELAFELAPGIDLAPETEFDLSGGLAARFYF